MVTSKSSDIHTHTYIIITPGGLCSSYFTLNIDNTTIVCCLNTGTDINKMYEQHVAEEKE